MLDVPCDRGWPRRGCMGTTKGQHVFKVEAFTELHMQSSRELENLLLNRAC